MRFMLSPSAVVLSDENGLKFLVKGPSGAGCASSVSTDEAPDFPLPPEEPPPAVHPAAARTLATSRDVMPADLWRSCRDREKVGNDMRDTPPGFE